MATLTPEQQAAINAAIAAARAGLPSTTTTTITIIGGGNAEFKVDNNRFVIDKRP